jgi:hypothetical protein
LELATRRKTKNRVERGTTTRKLDESDVAIQVLSEPE